MKPALGCRVRHCLKGDGEEELNALTLLIESEFVQHHTAPDSHGGLHLTGFHVLTVSCSFTDIGQAIIAAFLPVEPEMKGQNY